MADDLASIISGTDPMSPLQLRVLQSQQLLNAARDASQWQNQGIFGALGRTIAAAQGSSGANDVMQQLAAQKAAGLPGTFQALASGNPYAYGANPQNKLSPSALASILANAPSAAEAGLKGLEAANIRNTLQSLNPAAAAPGAAPQPLSKPTARTVIPPAGSVSPVSTTPAPQTAIAPTPDDATYVSGVAPALAQMPTAQRGLVINTMTPGQKAAFANYLRQAHTAPAAPAPTPPQ